jgi:hypothetical protein
MLVASPIGAPQLAATLVRLLVVAGDEVGNVAAVGSDLQVGERLEAIPVLGSQGTAGMGGTREERSAQERGDL